MKEKMTKYKLIANIFSGFNVKVFFGLLFLSQGFFGHVNAIGKRTLSKNYRVSIAVPCHYKHAIYLPELLNAYAAQTVLPKEVVISLSEVDLVAPEILNKLSQKESWPFQVVVIKHIRKVSEGENRNIACARTKGNVVALNDADDLPHPQRVEVVKHIFENYNISCLVHSFSTDESKQEMFNVKDIELYKAHGINERGPMANGAPVFHRKLLHKVKWPQEFKQLVDVYLLEMILANYHGAMYCANIPLYLYRWQLSTYRQ